MTDDDDYGRLESDIDDFDIDIYARYGDHYKNLSDEKKEEALNIFSSPSPYLPSPLPTYLFPSFLPSFLPSFPFPTVTHTHTGTRTHTHTKDNNRMN